MSKIRLYGATSGYVDLAAPDVSPDATVKLPDADIATESYADAAAAAAVDAYDDSPALKTNINTATFSSSTSFVKISCFQLYPPLNRGGFTVTTSDITVPQSGLYLVSWNVRLSSTTLRTNTGVAVGVNNSWDLTIYAAHSYARAADGHNEVSSNASGLLALNSGDLLHLYGRQEGNTASQSSTIGYGSFNVVRVGSRP